MVAFLVPAPLFEKLPHVLAAGLSAESLAHSAYEQALPVSLMH